MLYQKLLGRGVPQNTLVLPLQYFVFGTRYHCLFFVEILEELGQGTFKFVEKARVIDIMGRVPIPEVTSLKGESIALYRPRQDASAFVDDIISIVQLDQLQPKNFAVKANLIKVRGHSLYVPRDHREKNIDYLFLHKHQRLTTIPNIDIFIDAVQHSFEVELPLDDTQQLVEEILDANDVVNSPFMFCPILPGDIKVEFTRMNRQQLLQNVYQMVSTVAFYAEEGIFFRDLQPDNFRCDTRREIKIIDPSYIHTWIAPNDRYTLFFKQTSPEYLPNHFSRLHLEERQQEIFRYFGEFTSCVCIGMLERVIKRVFMAKYMGDRYDELHQIQRPIERIMRSDALKYQEDMDFFGAEVSVPSPEQFALYARNIGNKIMEEGWPADVAIPVGQVLSALRRFSMPIPMPNGYDHLLFDEKNQRVSLEQLPRCVMNILKINCRTQLYTRKAPASKHSSSTISTAKTSQVVTNEEVRRVLNHSFRKAEKIPVHYQQEKRDLSLRQSQTPLPNSTPAPTASPTISRPPVPPHIAKLLEKKPNKTTQIIIPKIERQINESTSDKKPSTPLPVAVADIQNKKSGTRTGGMRDIVLLLGRLANISRFLKEHRIFYQYLQNCLANNTQLIEEDTLQNFFRNADLLFSNQETDMTLFRIAKQNIPADILKILERTASFDCKKYFSSPRVEQKCYNVLSKFLARVAKMRFLCSFDGSKSISDYMLQPGEDVLSFIRQYDPESSFYSEQEIIAKLATELV